MGRQRFVAAVALPIVLVLAACTSGGGSTPSPTTAAAPSVAPSTEASQAAPSTEASQPAASASPTASATTGTTESYDVKVGSGAVGKYLTGEDGKTLYVFKNDVVNSGKSACNGQCATFWPAFVVESLDELKPDSGVTGKLTLITRDDGTKQVAYNGQPVYYYSKDTAAGQTNGEGVGGVWTVAKP
jgi:predicted lipoprotein with Yx(FWY)xxD motif